MSEQQRGGGGSSLDGLLLKIIGPLFAAAIGALVGWLPGSAERDRAGAVGGAHHRGWTGWARLLGDVQALPRRAGGQCGAQGHTRKARVGGAGRMTGCGRCLRGREVRARLCAAADLVSRCGGAFLRRCRPGRPHAVPARLRAAHTGAVVDRGRAGPLPVAGADLSDPDDFR